MDGKVKVFKELYTYPSDLTSTTVSLIGSSSFSVKAESKNTFPLFTLTVKCSYITYEFHLEKVFCLLYLLDGLGKHFDVSFCWETRNFESV
jgi:hypothetical protein